MIKKKQRQHNQDKNKTEASLGGLFLWLSLGSFLGKLSRSDLEFLESLTKGNSLKGLNKKSWLLCMRGLSTTCGLCSLLGYIRVQAFARLCRP